MVVHVAVAMYLISFWIFIMGADTQPGKWPARSILAAAPYLVMGEIVLLAMHGLQAI